MSQQRKSRKRTLIDIIGMDEYLEYQEMIDEALNDAEEQQQNQQQEMVIRTIKKSGKIKSLKRGKSSQNSRTKRKAAIQQAEVTNQDQTHKDQTVFGFPSSLAEMEKGLAVHIAKTDVKRRKSGNKLGVLSSDEEEDGDDTSTIRNMSEANHQGLMPKLTQFEKQTEDGEHTS